MKIWSSVGKSSLSLLLGAMLLLTSCNHAEKKEAEYVSSPILPENKLRIGLYLSNDYGEIDSRDNALILYPDSYRLLARMRDGNLYDFSGKYSIRKHDGVFPGLSLYTKDQEGKDFIQFYLVDYYDPLYLSIERGPRPLVVDENGVTQEPGPSFQHQLAYLLDVDIDRMMKLSTDELDKYLCDLKGVPQ